MESLKIKGVNDRTDFKTSGSFRRKEIPAQQKETNSRGAVVNALSSTVGPKSGYPELFHDFPRSPRENSWLVDCFTTLHHSLPHSQNSSFNIVLTFDAVKPVYLFPDMPIDVKCDSNIECGHIDIETIALENV
jgi:hypothetical protein